MLELVRVHLFIYSMHVHSMFTYFRKRPTNAKATNHLAQRFSARAWQQHIWLMIELPIFYCSMAMAFLDIFACTQNLIIVASWFDQDHQKPKPIWLTITI